MSRTMVDLDDDALALAIALAGFVVVGPMELFLVEEAAALYGAWVWVIMLVAYALVVLLVVLLLRPRLVVYNIALEQLRPLLADVVARLDPEARWAGESLVMPRLGVQLHLESAPLLNNVQLVSSGPAQALSGWRQLEVPSDSSSSGPFPLLCRRTPGLKTCWL